MVSLFKDRSPAVIIWLFILGIVVHSHFLVAYIPIQPSQGDGLISFYFSKYAPVLSPAFVIFLYTGIVFLQSLRLNYLFTDQHMYSKVNFLPAMVYTLLTGIFTEWNALLPSLVDNIMVIWLFAKVIRLYNCPDPKTLLFNIGWLAGVSILLYHPSAMLIIVAYFALMTLRPFVITEWLVLLIGLFVLIIFSLLICISPTGYILYPIICRHSTSIFRLFISRLFSSSPSGLSLLF